jgi:hypothetical protein
MSVNTYTTTDLVSLIQLMGNVPISNTTFSNTSLLSLADIEIQTAIMKQLKATDEGYFQTNIEYTMNASGFYPIPSDSTASTVYALQIRNGQAIWPLTRQEVQEMTTTTFPSTGNWSYQMQSNTFQVLPNTFSGVLRVVYERRPSNLVAVTSCAQVSSIVGQVITVGSLPSAWVVGTVLDLQMAQPHFDVLSTVTITAINGVNVTVSGDVSDLSVGDFLCYQGQTCVPQIPVEFRPLLAQRVVCKIYERQGYLDKLKAAKTVLKEMEDALTAIVTPRNESSPKVIAPSWGGRKPGNSWGRFNPPAGASG